MGGRVRANAVSHGKRGTTRPDRLVSGLVMRETIKEPRALRMNLFYTLQRKKSIGPKS